MFGCSSCRNWEPTEFVLRDRRVRGRSALRCSELRHVKEIGAGSLAGGWGQWRVFRLHFTSSQGAPAPSACSERVKTSLVALIKMNANRDVLLPLYYRLRKVPCDFFPSNQYLSVAQRFAASLRLCLHRHRRAALSFPAVTLQHSRRQLPEPVNTFWHVVIPPDMVGKLIFHRSRKGNDKETNQFLFLFIGTIGSYFSRDRLQPRRRRARICHRAPFTKLLSLHIYYQAVKTPTRLGGKRYTFF